MTITMNQAQFPGFDQMPVSLVRLPDPEIEPRGYTSGIQLEFPGWQKMTIKGHLRNQTATGSLYDVTRAMEQYQALWPTERQYHDGRASYDDWWVRSEQGILDDEYDPDGEPDPEERITHDNRPELEGLRLDNSWYADATRRLEWDTFQHKAEVMAARLGVLADELCKYVASLVRRAPRDNGNGWDFRQEIESAIWLRLVRDGHKVTGNWSNVKLMVSFAYKTWYARYTREHTADKERQAISLDREAFQEDLASGEVTLQIESFEQSIDSKWSVSTMVDSLPLAVRGIVEKRLLGVPTTPGERKRLSRFLATNTPKVLAMLGTGETQEWSKSTRK